MPRCACVRGALLGEIEVDVAQPPQDGVVSQRVDGAAGQEHGVGELDGLAVVEVLVGDPSGHGVQDDGE